MSTTLGDHTMYFVFDDKMINYQHIWLKLSQQTFVVLNSLQNLQA